VKISMENGATEIGALLVSSSASDVAMRGDPSGSVGALVRKAREVPEEGGGVIMAQMILR